MGKIALLILGGDVLTPDLANIVHYDAVFCADSGVGITRRLAIKPDYVLGDFDSVSEDDLNWARNCNSEITVYPAEKDETDGELCAKLIANKGFESVCVLGVFGGRIDHVFGNLQLLKYFFKIGIKAVAYHDGFEVSVVSGTNNFVASNGDLISVFALGKSVFVRLINLKYEYAGMLESGTARGISNVALGDFTVESNGPTLVFHKKTCKA